MPRKSPSSRARSSKSRARAKPDRSSLSVIRTVIGKVRDLVVGLGLISAVSFVPQSVVEQLPVHAQTAMGIATDIRSLLVDVGADAANGIGALLDGTSAPAPVVEQADSLLSELTGWLPAGLTDWLPWAGGGAVPPGHAPRTASTFGAAKGLLYDRIYHRYQTTFYCGCTYNRSRETSLNDCGLGVYAGQPRADRVEAEHVFPAAQFGHYRNCWRTPSSFSECREADGDLLSGRDCCQRVDSVFTSAHNDLINLVPAVGLINGARSNYNWGMVSRGESYGTCEIRIDSSIRRVQPPEKRRGDIARIMLYMQDTYGFTLSRQDQQIYEAWNNADPPDAWEIERNERIARLQGKGNDYVSAYRPL